MGRNARVGRCRRWARDTVVPQRERRHRELPGAEHPCGTRDARRHAARWRGRGPRRWAPLVLRARREDARQRRQEGRQPGVADVHPLGEHGERGEPTVEGHDLAIEQHVVGHPGSRKGAQLREAHGDVVPVAGQQCHVPIGDIGQHAHSVPFDLMCPLWTAGNRVSLTSQHGAHGSILTHGTVRVPDTRIRNELEGDLIVRAIWKGAVSFGLVNVPVRLYSATENHDVQFRQVHRTDGGRIRYQRICSIDGDQVSYDDIAKGYETEDGQMVVLTDEDMADLPTRSSREIAVEKFVPADQIDPMVLDKSYYLEPDKTATKAYALLRDALKAADRMAIVTVSIRARMTIAVLRVRHDVIVMQTMLWPDEIRSPQFADPGEDLDAKPAELAMAHMLVESLAGDYIPDDYEDDYQVAVESVVKAK